MSPVPTALSCVRYLCSTYNIVQRVGFAIPESQSQIQTWEPIELLSTEPKILVLERSPRFLDPLHTLHLDYFPRLHCNCCNIARSRLIPWNSSRKSTPPRRILLSILKLGTTGRPAGFALMICLDHKVKRPWSEILRLLGYRPCDVPCSRRTGINFRTWRVVLIDIFVICVWII